MTRNAIRLAALASAAALAGCSLLDRPDRGRDTARALEFETTASAEPSALESRLPEEVEQALVPELRIEPQQGGDALEQRFDVMVKDAPAREFFLSLVEGTPLNIILDPGVDGTISLALKNVTVEQVLSAVQDVYGYEHRKTSYGYHVLPGGLQTRTFEVNYLNVQRRGSSQTRVSSGQVSSVGSTSSLGASSSSSTPAPEESTTSGTSIQTDSTSDFWADLAAGLTAIVGSGAGRSVTTSPNGGLVTVRAFPAELRAAERFLAEIGRSMTRQVVLEAKVLEVTLNDGYQSGIDYTQIMHHDGYEYRATQAGASSLVDQGSSELGSTTFPLDPIPLADANSILRPLRGNLFGGAVAFDVVTDDFAGFMELLESQGSVKTLSNPRVSTVNNQKAVIKVGSDEFFVTGISQTTVASGSATTQAPEIELTPFFSGIALDVTPQVGANDEITLHIHPSVSKVKDQLKTITVGTTIQNLPLAQSTIRESDSIVHTQSGRVVVIGGLMQTTDTQDEAGIPYLMRIPLLGWLFRQQRDSLAKTELVILLRATAMRPDDWDTIVRNAQDRFRRMDRGGPADADIDTDRPVRRR